MSEVPDYIPYEIGIEVNAQRVAEALRTTADFLRKMATRSEELAEDLGRSPHLLKDETFKKFLRLLLAEDKTLISVISETGTVP